MNFPVILTAVSLAGGGLVYASQVNGASEEAEARPAPVIREALLDTRPDAAPESVEAKSAATIAAAPAEEGSKDEVDELKARIAELEKENEQFNAIKALQTEVQKKLGDQLKHGRFLSHNAEAGKALAEALRHMGKDPAKILGIETEADRARYNEILKSYGDRYRELAKQNETVENRNDNWKVITVKPFPEEGAALREDLENDLRAFSSDDDKIEEAADALAPRYGGFGKNESRRMHMRNVSWEGKAGKDGASTDTQIEMVVMGDSLGSTTKTDDGDK